MGRAENARPKSREETPKKCVTIGGRLAAPIALHNVRGVLVRRNKKMTGQNLRKGMAFIPIRRRHTGSLMLHCSIAQAEK